MLEWKEVTDEVRAATAGIHPITSAEAREIRAQNERVITLLLDIKSEQGAQGANLIAAARHRELLDMQQRETRNLVAKEIAEVRKEQKVMSKQITNIETAAKISAAKFVGGLTVVTAIGGAALWVTGMFEKLLALVGKK